MRCFHAFWLALFFSIVSVVWGETALFVPGAVNGVTLDSSYGIDATYLRGPRLASLPDSLALENWGAYTQLSVGHPSGLIDRSLMRFPLAQLAGRCRVIRKARLALTLDGLNIGFIDSVTSISRNLELYRVTSANASWNEGSASGSQLPGAACWAGLRGAGAPWAGDEGCGLPGKDFEVEPLGLLTIPPAYRRGQLCVIEILRPDALQSWIDRPDTNAGFLLRSSGNEALGPNNSIRFSFYSDDHLNLLARPRLELEYDALPLDKTAQAAFQPGVVANAPAPSYDIMATSIFSGDDGSYGAAPVLRVGLEPQQNLSPRLWRSLLKFDIARLRNKVAAVRALRLTLTVQSLAASGDTLARFHHLQLQRLAAANAPWREGSSTTGSLEAGAATWSWLARGKTRWASAPTPVPCASRVIVPTELHEGDAITFDIADPAFLTEWIGHPEKNAGFILSSPSLESADPSTIGQILFHSDDSPQPALRPRLEVFYQPYASADPQWLAISP